MIVFDNSNFEDENVKYLCFSNDKTPYDYLATLVIHDKFGNVIKALTKQINN